MEQLEQDIIGFIRTAIEHLDSDHAVVGEQMRKAHDLFTVHLMEWSEAFAMLYRQMYEVYCAYTPKKKAHYRTSSVGIGYSAFPVKRRVPDKIQPVPPTSKELVTRFDHLISAYASSKQTA